MRWHDRCRLHDSPPRGQRGLAGQRAERALELSVRIQAAEVGNHLEGQGWTQTQAARFLRLSPRTLRQWQHDHVLATRDLQALGRPTPRAPRELRNQVIHLIDEQGPAVGVPALRLHFPDLPRAELQDLLKRYRRVWRQRHRQPLRVLHWTVPGSVWAIDFTGPLTPIDGRYPYLLAVRDLASGRQLLWQPFEEATAATAVRALAPLFALHGAPLVLKSDNGSTFTAEGVLALLRQSGVIPLFSPPGLPSYNGAIEAGIGSLKSRTQDHAARHGRVDCWSYDDVTAARLEANATARPKGPTDPTPDEAWASRRPISTETRALFQATVQRLQGSARADQGQPEAGPLTVLTQRAVDRSAVRRALEEHGYLLYSRRRILPPVRKREAARIT